MQRLAVLGLMTREAMKGGGALSVNAAPDVHSVRMIVVALEWAVIRGMAVQAARAGQNGGDGAKGQKALLIVSRVCLVPSERVRRKPRNNGEQEEHRRADTN